MRVVFVPIVFIGVLHLVHGRNISWKNYRVPTKVSDQTITVMSQNVKHVVSTDDMLEEIESVRPDILALTGVNDAFAKALKAHRLFKNRYHMFYGGGAIALLHHSELRCTPALSYQVWPEEKQETNLDSKEALMSMSCSLDKQMLPGILTLSETKKFVISAIYISAHVASKTFCALVEEKLREPWANVLLMGDFREPMHDYDITDKCFKSMIDYRTLTKQKPGFTFDTEKNALASMLHSSSRNPDKVLVRALQHYTILPNSFKIVGSENKKAHRYPSAHYGVVFELRENISEDLHQNKVIAILKRAEMFTKKSTANTTVALAELMHSVQSNLGELSILLKSYVRDDNRDPNLLQDPESLDSIFGPNNDNNDYGPSQLQDPPSILDVFSAYNAKRGGILSENDIAKRMKYVKMARKRIRERNSRNMLRNNQLNILDITSRS